MPINFTNEELQYVINVLAQRPYAEVIKLMQNIQTQVEKLNESTPSSI